MNDYSQYGAHTSSGPSPLGVIFYVVFIVALLVAMWKVFEKAGRPGWAAIVPLYNAYILLQIVGRPGWWLILYLIPFVNIVIALIVAIDLAKAFGRSTAFGILLLWLLSAVGYLILGFGKSTYKGPVSVPVPSPKAS